MKFIQPLKLKVLMMLFFGTGILGIAIGLSIAPSYSSQTSIFITFMGVINVCLGGFFGWIFLNQPSKEPDKRKRKPKGK